MYTGQAEDGIPHGTGTIVYRENDRNGRANYTGGWERGYLSGRGTMYWTNGAR